MSRTLTDMIFEDDGQKGEPLSPGARELLEGAGLVDVANAHDRIAMDEKAADVLMASADELPGDGRLPDSLRVWMAGLDQPARPETEWDRAHAAAVKQVARGAVQAAKTAAAVDPYARLDRESRDAAERAKQKERERMERRVGPAFQG